MCGLLYKDFAAIKGKRLVLILTIATVLFILLRMLFPGTEINPVFMATGENGEPVNMVDIFFCFGEVGILLFGICQINSFGSRILEFDDKNRIRGYLSALPVCKKTYVASKYIFLGICTYVVFSLYMMWHVVSIAFMQVGQIFTVSSLISELSGAFLCLILIIEAVELPMLLLMGKEKAMIVRISFWMLLAMIVIGFLLFGNLNPLGNWGIEIWTDWRMKHVFELFLLNMLSPLIALGIYSLSYCLSVRLYERKEENDE